MSETKFVYEKSKTHISCSGTFFPRKTCLLWDDVEKYFRAGQASDENTGHAHCMLHTWGFKRTVRICNAYCFYTQTVLARTLLNITLHVLCLSSYLKALYVAIHNWKHGWTPKFCYAHWNSRWNSLVGLATESRMDKGCVYSARLRPFLEPTQRRPIGHREPFPRAKTARAWSWPLKPSNADITNIWSYTSTPLLNI